ncbi:MAG TPA: hypothetical protein VLA97_14100, partial [Nocardioidaceae bacterium]|nr:hypothetical protein [Nocardioidaceae bacterium]
IEAGIVRRVAGGHVEVVAEPDAFGELALRPGWPSMFRGYLGDEERYRKCFLGGWYLTGDLARKDEDGYFWFVGRADDVIKSAGHLIGPFEVESALMEHPAVAEAGVLERGEDGRARVVDGHVREVPDGTTGELALRVGWPSMFRDYLDEHARYRRCFADGWYLTGDLARRDEDGYYWFVGRADDVIKSAGHLIGPFEVESALMEHPAVAEAGVIGKPDPVAGEVVKAFVTLRNGFEPTEQLQRELIAFGRRRLGSVAPREIAFDQDLPHTRSGKVMRRLLKARELGLPEGDLSTLERVS